MYDLLHAARYLNSIIMYIISPDNKFRSYFDVSYGRKKQT